MCVDDVKVRRWVGVPLVMALVAAAYLAFDIVRAHETVDRLRKQSDLYLRYASDPRAKPCLPATPNGTLITIGPAAMNACIRHHVPDASPGP